MLTRLLKKTIIALFTGNPYKIRSFDTVFKVKTGTPVDVPESLSAVLTRQTGELTTYYRPSSVNGEVLRYRTTGSLPRFTDSGIFKNPDRFLYSISGAGILGQAGLVYDPASRSFINESAKDWTQNLSESPYSNAYQLAPAATLNGLTLSFLSLGADGGFYHFLFESLIKAKLYASVLNQADHLLFNGPPTAWKQKWISRAKIDASKITWVTYSGHYRCEQLLFTNRLVADQQVSTWAADTLKSLFNISREETGGKAKRIIWLSRKGQEQRAIAWEDSILARLPEIERVDLAEMSVEETITIMQGATHVAGPHGAALGNLYLCAPGTKVLEIFPEGAYIQPCYARLSNVCQLSHTLLYLDFQNEENEGHGIEMLMKYLAVFLC